LKILDESGKLNPAAFQPVFGDFGDEYLAMYRRFSLGSVLSSPIVSGSSLFFGSTDGNCYCLQLPAGAR